MSARIKKIAVALLCSPWVGSALRALFRDSVPCLRARGLRISTASPAVLSRTVALIFWGVYESAEVRFVRRYLRSDLDVIELGSSIGVVSSAVAMKLEPGRRLTCVEANPDLLGLLRRNVESHGPDLEIDCIHAAIDYDRDSVPFVAGVSNTAGRTDLDSEDSIDVPAATLAGIVARAGPREFALVSDIEGAEVAMLRRDEAALAACKQLLIELHPGPYDGRMETIENLREEISAHGFEFVAGHGSVNVFERRPDSGP